MSKRSANLLLGDIVASAQKIIRYTENTTYEVFLEDEKTIDAVIRNFEIIGEAANRLPDDIKEMFPAVDWFRIRGFRNRIVHDYMGVDLAIVWKIKESYLPTLIEDVSEVIGKM
jgi:uncharacterized protein with HEPN domain